MDKPLHIWVVGASRGIGLETAKLLEQSHRITTSSRTHDPARRLSITCDVASEASVHQAHETAVRVNGAVDVLVYSAGIGVFDRFVDIQSSHFDELFNVNVKGLLYCAQAVLPSMMSGNHGMIVHINSVAAIRSFPGNAAYAASKSACKSMLGALREEVRFNGIKIVDLIVGATATGIWPKDMLENHCSRMMQPEDVASVVKSVVDSFSNGRLMLEEVIIRPQGGDI